MYSNKKDSRASRNTWVTAGLLLAGVFAFPACNTSKKITAVEPTKVETGMKPEAYLAQKIQYSTFSGKAQMHFENKDQNQDFSGNIRMQKDKNIWASVVALGIAEVAVPRLPPTVSGLSSALVKKPMRFLIRTVCS